MFKAPETGEQFAALRASLIAVNPRLSEYWGTPEFALSLNDHLWTLIRLCPGMLDVSLRAAAEWLAAATKHPIGPIELRTLAETQSAIVRALGATAERNARLDIRQTFDQMLEEMLNRRLARTDS